MNFYLITFAVNNVSSETEFITEPSHNHSAFESFLALKKCFKDKYGKEIALIYSLEITEENYNDYHDNQ